MWGQTLRNRCKWGVWLLAKVFPKKFVIVCHRLHTFTWLNLLLEPKRHLQRFGFVFLGDASFCGLSQKEQEKQEEVPSCSCLLVFSHKERHRRDRSGGFCHFCACWLLAREKNRRRSIFCHRREKIFKIFLSSLSPPCIQLTSRPNKIKGFMLFVGFIVPTKIFFVYPLARKPQDML